MMKTRVNKDSLKEHVKELEQRLSKNLRVKDAKPRVGEG